MDKGTSKLYSEQKSVIQEKKKTRNIGSKSKRLHMHSEDAMELKFTWEENCELEEYDVSRGA